MHELADGEVAAELYTHHPALYTHLIALSLRVFGDHEWAVWAETLPEALEYLFSFANEPGLTGTDSVGPAD